MTTNNNLNKTSGDEFIIAGLVESDFITGTIKTVFERKKQNTFLTSLEEFVDKQRDDIHALCSDHYEEFLTSVSKLKTVRNDALALRTKVITLDESLQEAGSVVLEQGRKLLSCRRMGENIRLATEIVHNCKLVSDLNVKAVEQIKNKQYYPALRTIEQMEQILPRIYKYNYAKFIEKSIPEMRGNIKAMVQSEFNDWLTKIRQQSASVGERIMNHMRNRLKTKDELKANQKQNDPSQLSKSQSFSDFSVFYLSQYTSQDGVFGNIDSEPPPPSPSTKSKGPEKNSRGTKNNAPKNLAVAVESKPKDDPDRVDFTPVYRANSIFAALASLHHSSEASVPASNPLAIANTNEPATPNTAATLNSFRNPYAGNSVSMSDIPVGQTGMTSADALGPATSIYGSNINSNVIGAGGTMLSNPDDNRKFALYYKRMREKQLMLDIQKKPSKGASWDEYRQYLAKVVGFFAIENVVLQSTTSVLSMAEMSSAWEHARLNVRTVLDECLASITDIREFIKIKDTICVFALTMQDSIGMHVSPLFELLEGYKTEFSRLLVNKLQLEVEQEFEDEKYEPMEVRSADEYQLLIDCNLQPAPEKSIKFPLLVPFSRSVPSVCVILTRYLENFFEYSKYLTDIDEIIRMGLDELLRLINRKLDAMIDDAQASVLSQHAQISLNCSSMVDACAYFEKLYFAKSNRQKVSPFLNPVREQFRQTRARAEDMIFKSLLAKIDMMMTLSESVNWLPTTKVLEPNDYVVDVIRYLEPTLKMIKFLPNVVREAVNFKACQHLAGHIQSFLSGPIVKHLNRFAVESLRLDVLHAEQFAATLSDKCKFCFVEVKQLIDFVLDQNISADMTPEDEERVFENYANVYNLPDRNKRPRTLASIIEKFKAGKEVSNSRNTTTTSSKETKPKKWGWGRK